MIRPSISRPGGRTFLEQLPAAVCVANANPSSSRLRLPARPSPPPPAATRACRPGGGGGGAPSSIARNFCTSTVVLGKSPPGRGKDARRRARVAARLGNRADEVDKAPPYVPLDEATRLLQAVEVTRPMSAYELHVVTSVGSHQANALRGRVSLPKDARTRSERLLVFADDGSEAAEVAKRSRSSGGVGGEGGGGGGGGDEIIVGGTELIADVQANRTPEFTKVLCTPQMLPAVSKALARSLGPKGLMPSAKRGTVAATADEMALAIANARGAMDWRGDKNGVVRGAVGRIHFATDELRANISTLLAAIIDKVQSGLGGSSGSSGSSSSSSSAATPTTTPFTLQMGPEQQAARRAPQAVKRASGIIKQIHLSSTQGPAVLLDLAEVL